jgi:hypothetical protein
MLATIENTPDLDDLAIQAIVDGKRKAPGKRSMEVETAHMDTRMQQQ